MNIELIIVAATSFLCWLFTIWATTKVVCWSIPRKEEELTNVVRIRRKT